MAGAGGEVAAVVAPAHELDLAVVAAHLGILARRAVPEMQCAVGHAACEKSTIAAEVYRETGGRPFVTPCFVA